MASLVISCGGGPAPGPLTADVLATPDAQFDPSTISAPGGTQITLNLINDTVIEHDIVLVGEVFDLESELNRALADNPDLRLAATELISPGETGSITITLDEPGEYQYFCSVPSHFALGMRGILTVDS